MRKIWVSLLLLLFLLPTALSENRVKIDLKVNSGYDDAYEKNGKMYIRSATVEMGKQSSTVYRGGFRFTNISLPKGAIIEDAELSLAYNWASASKTNITLYGEASDNALQFKTASKNISNRIKTIANIRWNNLNKTGYGKYLSSPNVSSIIQEVINRQNWKEGNSIVLLGYESSKSVWESISYNGNKKYSAELKITALIPSSCVESWSCTEWNECINLNQTRICTDLNNCGTNTGKPVETRSCICNESWNCTEWSECIDGNQTRGCIDINDCGTMDNKPAETRDCIIDLCKDIICTNSTRLCSDGFIAKCENTCNNGICSNCIPSCAGHEGNRSTVMIVMDDLQKDWLEDVAVAITNINLEEGVDIVLNVIPIDIGTSSILSSKLKEWNVGYVNLIEIGEHGYTHDGNEYNMGSMSYTQQKGIIQNGLNELKSIGITPLSFTPPGGDQNPTTLQVLGDMGFHTIFDCYIGSVSTSKVLALKQCEVWLCNAPNTNGPSCRFDSSSNIIRGLDSMINHYGYGVLVFHMQDFSTSNGGIDLNKINQYGQLLRDLKLKYRFMTAEEYYQTKKT